MEVTAILWGSSIPLHKDDLRTNPDSTEHLVAVVEVDFEILTELILSRRPPTDSILVWALKLEQEYLELLDFVGSRHGVTGASSRRSRESNFDDNSVRGKVVGCKRRLECKLVWFGGGEPSRQNGCP